jgi:voltage-gated potassium channel
MPYSFLDGYKLEFNNSFNNEQPYVSDFKVNYLLAVCSCARTIPFFTAIIVNSKFSKGTTYRVCRINGTCNNLIFAIRLLFKENPFLFISVVFISSVLIFSYAFRIAECEFISQYTVTAYLNMLWMTVITMTTVGFGDYTPKTPIGRIVGILCMSWGVLIVSVMVAVLTNTLSLNSR